MTSRNLASPMGKKRKEIVINLDGRCGGKRLCLDILSLLCLIDMQLRMFVEYSGSNKKLEFG